MHAAVVDHAKLVKPTDNAIVIRLIDAHRVQPVDLEVLANLANQDDKVREARLACPVFPSQCQHNKIRDVSDARPDHQVRMAHPDPLVKTDRKARPAIPEVMVVLAVLDLRDRQEMLANRDAMANQVALVDQAKVAVVDAKVPLDQQANRVVLAEKVNVVQLETMVNRVHRVQLVSPAHREVQVPPAAEVNQDSRAQLDRPETTLSIARVRDAVSLLAFVLETTVRISRICHHNRHVTDRHSSRLLM